MYNVLFDPSLNAGQRFQEGFESGQQRRYTQDLGGALEQGDYEAARGLAYERGDIETGMGFDQMIAQQSQAQAASEEERRNLYREAMEQAAPMVDRALSSQDPQRGLQVTTSYLMNLYPTIADEIAESGAELAVLADQDIDAARSVFAQAQTQDPQLRIITGEDGQRYWGRWNAQTQQIENTGTLASQPAPSTTVQVPGIVGYDEEGRPIQGVEPLERSTGRDAARTGAATSQQAVESLFGTAGAVSEAPERAFGIPGQVASYASLLSPILGEDVADRATETITGGANVEQLREVRTRTRAAAASIIPTVTGDESGRYTDREQMMARELADAMDSMQTREGLLQSLSILTALRIADVNRQSLQAFGRPTYALVMPDGELNDQAVNELGNRLLREGYTESQVNGALEDVISTLRGQYMLYGTENAAGN